MENKAEAETHNRQHRDIIVNGRLVRIADPEPIGSQILAEAGFEPTDEHVLIARARIGSRLISLDERVPLGGDEDHRFYAFRNGEVFMFTINEHGYQWGKGTITEPELRELGRVPEGDVLFLESDHDEPRILAGNDIVRLSAAGTEHLRTERRLIEVFLNGVPKEIPRGTYTTEELITSLGVEPGYLLNLAEKDGLHPLQPHESIHVRKGMRFFSQVPGGGSS
jgi:hypothetical protein